MKFISLVVFFCALCQGAVAQTPECSKIQRSSDRLACYDRVTPPSTVNPARSKAPLSPDKAAASRIPPDQGRVVDMLAAENSKLDARLKTICRGC
jgi:hypothetical protein